MPGGGRRCRIGGPLAGRPGRTDQPGRGHRRRPPLSRGRGKAGVEVRRHDILADPLEPAAYDLVHCRALLLHLADPQQALRNMAAAVRPGGWLLIEDADYVTLVAADPAHPRSARFDQVMRKLLTFFSVSRAYGIGGLAVPLVLLFLWLRLRRPHPTTGPALHDH